MNYFNTNPMENQSRFNEPPHLPHHHHPHHVSPHIRTEPISIQADTEMLNNAFGELWPFQLEAISKEPAEMKILFALQVGLKLTTNYKLDPTDTCRFENPALTDEVLEDLENRVGVDKQTLFSILDIAPPGVIAIICATLNK